MVVFKFSLTFFFFCLIALAICVINLTNDSESVNYGRLSGSDLEARKVRRDMWQKWTIRFAIGVGVFVWLAIVGLIWH